jgi:hypothetical protein
MKKQPIKQKKSLKRSLAKLLLGSILLLAILGVISVVGKVGSAIYNNVNSTEEIAGEKFIKIKDKVNESKAIAISEDLAQRISNNSNLPEGSEYYIWWLEDTQESNAILIDHLLEQLASELGSSETLGILRTIRDNKEKIFEASQLIQSADPQIANNAKEKTEKLREEIALLTKKLADSYSKDGFELTEAQVQSLIYSPHGEETASIINCFQNIKAICFVLENRLRKHPSHEMARKYYGAYHAMLLALDKIQKNAISKIHHVHIPETAKLRTEARIARETAIDLLSANDSSRHLSFNQKEALRYNIESCKKTERKADQTEDKLFENSRSLEQSNTRLQYAIATAENSHIAMRVHTEIERIGQDHLREIQKLEEITLPDMIAADFSDPDAPWLSPPRIMGN